MAWSGWWHNQIGLLTEVASARVAAPIEQQRAVPGARTAAGGTRRRGTRRRPRRPRRGRRPLPPPTDINPRTEYPRPWMGGRWTLRDIVDYELIATMALLDTVADRRETLLRQIYEVNRQTVEAGTKGDPAAILDPGRDAARSARSGASGREAADGRRRGLPRRRARSKRTASSYAAGHVRGPDGAGLRALREGHAREADLPGSAALARRRRPSRPTTSPRGRSACCSASSTRVAKTPIAADGAPREARRPPDARRARHGQRAALRRSTTRARRRQGAQRAAEDRARRATLEAGEDKSRARRRSPNVTAQTDRGRRRRRSDSTRRVEPPAAGAGTGAAHSRAPRSACISRWRRQHGRRLDALGARAVRVPVHHAAQRRRPRRQARQTSSTRSSSRIRAHSAIIDGSTGANIRPEYRGGIGDGGRRRAEAVRRRRRHAGHARRSLGLRDRELPVPVRNLKRGLTRDQHFAPGTILKLEVDTHASGRLRHGRRDLRVLQQQPVLRAGRRLRVAAHDRRRALSERPTWSRRAGCGAKS